MGRLFELTGLDSGVHESESELTERRLFGMGVEPLGSKIQLGTWRKRETPLVGHGTH